MEVCRDSERWRPVDLKDVPRGAVTSDLNEARMDWWRGACDLKDVEGDSDMETWRCEDCDMAERVDAASDARTEASDLCWSPAAVVAVAFGSSPDGLVWTEKSDL
mmetsp:Transcript_52065/g.86789  ORF Transcript_52065/g.86789 Transcript_52065/m.86789 type:complete len:105 (+) Transcript_52065:117-431(+)